MGGTDYLCAHVGMWIQPKREGSTFGRELFDALVLPHGLSSWNAALIAYVRVLRKPMAVDGRGGLSVLGATTVLLILEATRLYRVHTQFFVRTPGDAVGLSTGGEHCTRTARRNIRGHNRPTDRAFHQKVNSDMARSGPEFLLQNT